MKNSLILIFFSILLFSACDSQEKKVSEQFEIDKKLIQDYAKDNNLTLESHESGIFFINEKQGTGTKNPKVNSTVTTHYRGIFLNGDQFDTSYGGSPLEFSLGRVIQGWQIAIPLMVVGEKTKFFIPSKLGYGPNGTNGIPKNSVLIFDIELKSFK